MSKQSEAKATQAYVAKPTWPVCGNCEYFRSDIVTTPARNAWSTDWTEEKNIRCGLGEFKVAKLGTCKSHHYVRTE